MRRGWRGALCILLCWAGLVAADAEVIRPDPAQGVIALNPLLGYWRDPASVADLNMASRQQFQPLAKGGNLGFDESAHWFRFRLQNPGSEPQAWILRALFPVTDQLTFYVPQADGSYQPLRTGDAVPWAERPLSLYELALPFNLPPRTAQDYYLRMETSSAAIAAFKLYTPEGFWTALARAQLWLGLFYGALLVVVLYNAFLFFSTGERVYLFYALSLLPIMTYLLCMDGLFYMLLPWPGVIQNLALPAMIGLSCLFSLFFVSYYLNLHPGQRWYFLNRALAALAALSVLLLPLLGVVRGTQLVLIVGTVSCFYLMGLGLAALRFAREVAPYFVAGWTVFWLSQVGAAVSAFGLLPFMEVFMAGIKLSLLWTVLMLSLGLGIRLRLMKDAEARSEQAVMLAQAQSRAKSDFLAVMSHEIRTPLNGVMGMAEILKATGLSSEQSRIVATMEASGNALIDVINDILDYSKIEAGKMVLERARFDLDRLLDECLALFKPRVYKQQLTLLCSVASDVPTELEGDAVRLRQVLVNLLSNAVKFTSRGSIELQVRIETQEDGQLLLRIVVRDTGIGIGPEQLERIFDSFSQAESSTARQFGGTGLGLSISLQLCRLMGGDITVRSEPGRGSEFELSAQVSPVVDARPRDRLPYELAPSRVLLVDSDPRFCEIMQAEASLPCLSVDAVQTGQEAYAWLKEALIEGRPYQWLVTALQLRDMNGLSLHDRVRGDASLGEIKTLLFALPQLQPSPGVLVHAGVAQAFERPVRAQDLRLALFDAMRAGEPLLETSAGDSQPLQYPGLKVLVAEDNRTNQLVIQGILRQFGIQPVLVDNGRQAVSVYKATDYDLVLMDCEMPVLDGYSATREIRQFENQAGRRRAPILAISAHVTQHYIDNCYAAGMDDHIPNPVSSRSLAEKLERWAAL